MRNYLNLLHEVLIAGTLQENRTGIKAASIPGAMLKFDMLDGFPALTTKKLAFNQVKGELVGFIRGCDNAAEFRELGCTIWDQNANENQLWLKSPYRRGEDDLGRIYGVQWRDWKVRDDGRTYSYIDQLQGAIDKIKHNPTDRRIIVTAWNPAEIGEMALPPCHLLFQFLCNVETNELSICMYQRSCDMFLGVPFNIASYALLLHTVAALTGFKPRHLTMFLADVHIYENHFDQVREQLGRPTRSLPTLSIANELYAPKTSLEDIRPEHFQLLDYKPAAPIKAPMAV